MSELEALVEQMESGNLSLEDSLKSFERGIRLIRDCQATLSRAEQKVQMLVEQNGEPHSVPFESDETQ